MKNFLSEGEIEELKADHRAERELRYGDFPEFKEACKAFFRKKTWCSHKAELDTLLVDNFQIINA
ncbi:hypothetical protein OAO01_07800 [Oligoflexia bacterium]|nr:hypothetical protein [Oligoflexia bacterium]